MKHPGCQQQRHLQPQQEQQLQLQLHLAALPPSAAANWTAAPLASPTCRRCFPARRRHSPQRMPAAPLCLGAQRMVRPYGRFHGLQKAAVSRAGAEAKRTGHPAAPLAAACCSHELPKAAGCHQRAEATLAGHPSGRPAAHLAPASHPRAEAEPTEHPAAHLAAAAWGLGCCWRCPVSAASQGRPARGCAGPGRSAAAAGGSSWHATGTRRAAPAIRHRFRVGSGKEPLGWQQSSKGWLQRRVLGRCAS